MDEAGFQQALSQRIDLPAKPKCFCCHSEVDEHLANMYHGMCRKCYLFNDLEDSHDNE